MNDNERPEPVWDSWAGERPTLQYWPDTLTVAEVARLIEAGVGSPLNLNVPSLAAKASADTGISVERLRGEWQ